MSPQFAFVTLVTSDHYLPGALVVAAALHDVHPSPSIYPDELEPSEFDRVCLVTPETVDVNTVKQLRRAFDVVVGVEVIEEENEEGLKLLGRPDLKTVLTKLHVFRLTSYQKVIFLDADVLPLRPISHLFRISASFAAVPDVGWPDIFNSGFLVLEPSEEKFKKVMEVVKSKGSWDGGDQGVMNEWVGQDWERLSFTYNTTPTAVYTYAPAYKRFGSQISNIHFIGPNKPWLQIPFRSPGTSSVSSPTSIPLQAFAPPPSYAYSALLDRWFAVYDRHYRSPAAQAASQSGPTASDAAPSTSTGEFVAQRYESAWDTDVQGGVGTETSGVGAPLGLEELRRMAVEGVGESEAGDGEGAYRSLPLEGRVDLMRPQKPQSVAKEKPTRAVKILVPESPHPHTPTRSFTPMTTLPTPGPNEFPPTPVFRGHSLPPETPTHARVEGLSYVTPDHDHFQQPPGSGSSPRRNSPIPSSSPVRPGTPPRHASPPLLTWNPAVEAPPTAPPPESHFPEETYFPNVWDAPTQNQHATEDRDGYFPVPPPPSIPEMLIREGHYKAVIGEPRQEHHHHHHHHQPQSEENQQQQQHQDHQPSSYQPHEHHTHQSSHPLPDRSKVAAVFPWEEKPRYAPERFFPETDSPPPGEPFIQPQSPALKLDVRPPSGPVSPSASSLPPHGFPRTTTYDNAWDAVPSIQRYAARLVRPAPPTPVSSEWTSGSGRTRKGSAATAAGDEYRSWQDMVEVSSRDADDEDEGDDEEERSPPSGGAESDRSEGLREQPLSDEKKRYRVKSVQTVPREVRHQAVQVQSGGGKRNARSGSRHAAQRAVAKEKESPIERVSPPKFHRGLPKEMRVFEQTAVASPGLNAPGFMLPSYAKGQDQPQRTSLDDDRPHVSGALCPRLHDAYALGGVNRQISAQSAELESKASTLSSTVPELSPSNPESRTISIDIATAADPTSPPSSIGPSSPPEGAPILPGPQSTTAPTPRPAGRTFDPARGVDVFKKGSEEVLARFLRMGSWEDDSPTGTGSPSGA